MRFSQLALVISAAAMVPACATASRTSVPLAAACTAAAAQSLGCVPTKRGVVAAADAGEAVRLKQFAERAEERFRRFFGLQPARYLFISGTGPKQDQLSEAADLPVTLVWPSAAQRADASRVRSAVEASLAGTPLSPEQKEAAVRQAIVGAGLKTLAQEQANDAIAIPHELGHLWFAEAFWPGVPVSDEDRYVTPAPDWLDEGAAQLMELDGAAAFDRSSIVRRLQGENAILPGALPTLLVAPHPGQKLKKLVRGEPRSMGWTTEELEALGIESVDAFYARSAAISAFLIAKSGNEQILAEVARAYVRKIPFETWLAANGARYQVGSTVSEMEALLLKWLASDA